MKTYTAFFIFAATLALLSGCAFMQPDTNYAATQDNEYAAYAAQKNGTAEALEELGWSPSRSLTPEEQNVLERRMELNRKERDLISEKEREQYFALLSPILTRQARTESIS